MAKKEAVRLSLPALGEYYDDLLVIDAYINNRTKATQGQSLLCEKLQEREQRIKDRVAYLGKKRGVEFDDLWIQILEGRAEDLESEDD
jgi:hypothetical protein